MADSKNYGLKGIGPSVELGKGGARLEENAGALEARSNDGAALALVRGADPVANDDLVTLRYLRTQAHAAVTGQIDGNSPPAVVAGAVYVVTTAGGAYAEGELYYGEAGSWNQITVPEGYVVTVTDDLSGGNLAFAADRRYLWDADGGVWVDIGAGATVSAVQKSARATFDFNSGATVAVGSPLPNGGRPTRIVVDVTQAFNDPAATAEFGDAVQTDRLGTTAEVDLTTVGTYVIDCFHTYSSETQLNATLSLGAASAGQASVELVYSIT